MAQSQYKQRMFKASVTLILLSNKLFEIYCVQQSFLWVTTTWGSFPRGALVLGPNTSQLSGYPPLFLYQDAPLSSSEAFLSLGGRVPAHLVKGNNDENNQPNMDYKKHIKSCQKENSPDGGLSRKSTRQRTSLSVRQTTSPVSRG